LHVIETFNDLNSSPIYQQCEL